MWFLTIDIGERLKNQWDENSELTGTYRKIFLEWRIFTCTLPIDLYKIANLSNQYLLFDQQL